MGVKHQVYICVTCLLLALSLMNQLDYVPAISSANSISRNSPFWCLNNITPHAPIRISGNLDFISQGWSGNGTESDPYIIENLFISANEACINITDTDAFFKIKDCVLDADIIGNPGSRESCVYFRNVTNGLIVDSTISSQAHAVFIDDSDFCRIDGCHVSAEWRGLRIINCTSFILSNSRLMSNNTREFLAEYTNHLLIMSNHLIGGHSASGGVSVFESTEFEIRNNTIQSHENEGIFISNSSYGLIVNNSLSDNSASGIALWSAKNTIADSNSVYNNGVGFNLGTEENNCTLETNSIHHNAYGLWVAGDNNTIRRNSFFANVQWHADDWGQGNIWTGNLWDDYIGYGWYPVGGSYDNDPEPKNTPLLIMTVGSIILIISGCVVFSMILTKRARRTTYLEPYNLAWDTKEHFIVPLVLCMLLPSAIQLYMPAFSPADWSILVSTPLGVLSWRAYPYGGQTSLEFSLPLMGSFSMLLFYLLFEIVWFMLSAVVVRRFWLFLGGKIDRGEVLRTTAATLLIMSFLALMTMTIPIPLLPLAALVQISRFRK
ncbi:MAG: nitrous oxide reductase family maturation protein NosD [Candidatus Thorarchaeota archaeon]